MIKKKVFETERLTIRHFDISDQHAFFDLMGNPNVMNPIPVPVLNQEESDHKLIELINLHKINTEKKIWAITLKNNSNFIGLCGLIKNNENENEIAYRLRENYWGLGYGTEIAKGLIGYGFDKLKYDLITADAQISNIKSIQILEKYFKFDKELYNPHDNCTDRRYRLEKKHWIG